ncbi:hypothetical protein ACFOMD_06855 [Sphingoaurantiacus capsulatus]|uniref:Calcium-binding protein n=1 Tax=Sphingoaurantiacus capsulatus TaxID=1771310 RepID=A0ABV7XAL3_9SPHN
MGAILPFRIPQRGDWSPGERARLDELAARFADEAGVEVAYGLTDSGDPWCVVLDSRDEVLVHVAREGGSFVAHTADDLFVRSTDLATAVERVLGARWNEDRTDVVVPFATAGRASAQVVTAVLVVASFVYHHQVEAQTTDEWAFAAQRAGNADDDRDARDAAKPVTAADLLPTKDFHAAVTAVGLDDSNLMLPLLMESDGTADAPSRAVPEPSMSPGQHIAKLVIDASAEQPGGDLAPNVIVGTPGDDRLERNSGIDAPHHLLDGGDGNDHLKLDPGTVAIGGAGNDTFELNAPQGSTAATLLGIIVDYDPSYDVIVSNQPGGTATVVVLDQVALPNIFDDPNFSLGSLSASSSLPVLPGQRLTLDLDGDGIADGYLLLNNIAAEPMAMNDVREAFGLRGGPTWNHPANSGDNAAHNITPVSPAVFESHIAPPPHAGPEPIATLPPALPEVI